MAGVDQALQYQQVYSVQPEQLHPLLAGVAIEGSFLKNEFSHNIALIVISFIYMQLHYCAEIRFLFFKWWLMR